MRIKQGGTYSNNNSSLYVLVNNIALLNKLTLRLNLSFINKNNNKLIETNNYNINIQTIKTFWKEYYPKTSISRFYPKTNIMELITKITITIIFLPITIPYTIFLFSYLYISRNNIETNASIKEKNIKE